MTTTTDHRIAALQERIEFAAWLSEAIRALPISEAEFCRRHGLYRGYLNGIKKGRFLAGRAYMERVIEAMAEERMKP